jgi:transcriptional regulator GlxA family with amidase domain
MFLVTSLGATAIGYSSEETFSRAFKRALGKSPATGGLRPT